MSASAALQPSPPPSAEEDLPRLAADRLRHLLRQRHEGAVLADLLEEDLRAALQGLEALGAHLQDVFAALLAQRLTPLELLEASDDAQAQMALAALEDTLVGLRRRLALAAARVAAPRSA